MIDKDKVFDALRNCITEPKCKDCPWEECSKFITKKAEVPVSLLLDVLNLLKEQEPKTIVEKWHKNPLGDYSRLHCPWCDRELDRSCVREYVACPYCGMAVTLK